MARAKRDSRGYFYEVIELDRTDRRERKYIRAKTAAKLKEKVAKFHADQEAGVAPKRAGAEYTLAGWILEWLEAEIKRGKLRASTAKRYRSDIQNYIVPGIGMLKLRSLTVDNVQRFFDGIVGKRGTPLAPRSVRNIMTPLQECLEAAKRRGKVRVNVTEDVELPDAREPDLYKLTPEEVHRFLVTVRGDRFEALYWLGTLGFREGELLALRWANIEGYTIKITNGMQRVSQAEGGSKLTFIDTKTERGKRAVRMPEDWHHVLMAHKHRQDEERMVEGWQENDLVFPSTRGTPMEAQNFLTRHFKPALTRAELPAKKIRFHDFRHASASMLIVLGYDARTVADILGHSSPDFTLRAYAYAFDDVKERALADVGGLLRAEGRVLEIVPEHAKKGA